MALNLLEMVQDILVVLDGDEVNSIDETVEADRVAKIIRTEYDNLVARDSDNPDFYRLRQIDALSDSNNPTVLLIPDAVTRLHQLDYNISTTSTPNYRNLKWVEPYEFIQRNQGVSSSGSVQVVTEPSSNTEFVIYNDRMPYYWTSFDQLHIFCDAFDSDVDNTLQQSKTRAWVKQTPPFEMTNTFTIPFSDETAQKLLADAKNMALAVSEAANPTVARAARRQDVKSQDERKTPSGSSLPQRPLYGRKSRHG